MASVLILGGLIAAHHGGPLVDEQHDNGMNAAVEMCLGVFTAVGAALVALSCAVIALERWRPMLTLIASGTLTVPRVPVTRVRHGPAAVSVLCVSRR